jgi:hypothetical protein
VSTASSYQPQEAPDHDGSLSSVGQLLGEISKDISTLMRQEVELAKTEVRESVSQAGKAGSKVGGAAVAGHLALLFVSVALWWAWATASGVAGRHWSSPSSGPSLPLCWRQLAVPSSRPVRGLPKTTETVKKIPETFKEKDSR